jgi:hypothetical protein
MRFPKILILIVLCAGLFLYFMVQWGNAIRNSSHTSVATTTIPDGAQNEVGNVVPPAPEPKTGDHPVILPKAPNDVISVSGTKLLRNGNQFRLNAVQIDAFVGPLSWIQKNYLYYVTTAYNHFNATELGYAKQFGANSIEFKVSQFGFDSENPNFTPEQHAEYIATTTAAIRLARSMGFVVTASIMDTPTSGDTARATGLPTMSTDRVAVALANTFKDDRGVVIELYNEPFGSSKCTWKCYVGGGTDPGSGITYPGVNQIIRDVRATGSKNLILAEVLVQNFTAYEKYVNASGIAISDPLDAEFAYSLHPYFEFKDVGTTRASWDASFGNFAQTHPIVVTEWNENSGKAGPLLNAWCQGDASVRTPLVFLNYLNEKGINGVGAWSFDNPLTFVKDFKGTPRTMDGYQCGESGGGIGVWLQQYFNGTLPAA